MSLAGFCFAAAVCGQTNPPPPLELHVKKVLYLQMTQSPVVILVDSSEKQFLPIWIGFSEAQAIALEMEHFKPPRPMTHDLFPTVVKELDGKIEKLLITETKANTYYATLSVSTKDKTREIDCRPSDGIAIALRVKAPIFASESVMRNARPVPDEIESAGGAHRLELLPVTVQTLTPELAAALELGAAKGVLVSASQHPKVLRGDVIVAVGSDRLATVEQLKAALDKVGEGKDVDLKISRERQITTIRVTLDKRDESSD